MMMRSAPPVSAKKLNFPGAAAEAGVEQEAGVVEGRGQEEEVVVEKEAR